jgi:hypothetical protein
MAWSRLWPFLRCALGAQHPTPTLDIPRIIERLARGQPLTALPRTSRQGWAMACQLLVDYAAPLLPFWSDFEALLAHLRPLRGPHGLALVAFPDGNPDGRCWVHTEQDWQGIDSYRLPPPGTPVLVLSDLGCLDTTAVRRHQWRHLGLRLQRAGCRPVALMPCPARWWDPELTRLYAPVCWDRHVRPPHRLATRQGPPVPATRTAPAQDVGAELLLTLLAPAVRVEPALLRAVRCLLPARDADVGSEAAAWNHPHVHANPLAFYYDHDALQHYRDRFKHVHNTALRWQVVTLLAAYHAHLSPVIGEEERWLVADLMDAPAPDERLLARFVNTLRQTQESELRGAVHAWEQRMAQRQHASMWRHEVLAALWVAKHLQQIRQGEALAFPDGLELRRVSWLLTHEPEPQRYTLRQCGRALYLEADTPDQGAAALDAPGSPLAEVYAAAPYVQWRQSAWDHADHAMPGQPIDRAIPLPDSGCLSLYTRHYRG